MPKRQIITSTLIISLPLAMVLFILLDNLTIPFDTAPVSSRLDTAWIEDKGGMYEASATILALVSFGYVLGVRFGATVEGVRHQGSGIKLIFLSTVAVIISQTSIMLGLCCFGITQLLYGLLFAYTAIFLSMMVLGYYRIIHVQYYKALILSEWREQRARLRQDE